MSTHTVSRWWRTSTFALLLLTLSVPLARAEDRALLIGVGRYRMPGANLPGIDKDVEMMREALKLIGFRDSQIRVLADEAATLAAIQSAFETWLVQGVGPSDRVVFYFSGHGSRMADRNGDEPDRLDEILIPHDFEPTSGDPRSALVDDMLGQWLSKVPSRRVYAFIDACHSGTATKGLDEDKWLPYRGMPDLPEVTTLDRPKSAQRKDLDIGDGSPSGAANYLAVAAADDTELAQASSAGSYFTIGVLQAFRDAVKAGKPLSVLDIKNVTTASIAQQAGKPHRPQISGDLRRAGENLLGPTPAPPPPPPPPPPNSSLWSVFESIVDRIAPARRLGVTANQAEYRVRDLLQLSFDVAIDGYLNVLNVGEGEDEAVILFPNQYQQNNKVQAGNRVRVPTGKFKLPAGLPPGRADQRNLIVVVLTERPLNAYQIGSGSSFLRDLAEDAARSFAVEAAGSGDYFAGKVITVIRK
jgi:hypothetical protein